MGVHFVSEFEVAGRALASPHFLGWTPSVSRTYIINDELGCGDSSLATLLSSLS